MNNYMNGGQGFQPTQFFLSPQGNVYLLNNSFEAQNIPTGTGFNAAICPSENLLYIKTLQGTSVYKFTPYQPEQSKPQQQKQQQPDYGAQIAELRKEIEQLKKKDDKGGKINELL